MKQMDEDRVAGRLGVLPGTRVAGKGPARKNATYGMNRLGIVCDGDELPDSAEKIREPSAEPVAPQPSNARRQTGDRAVGPSTGRLRRPGDADRQSAGTHLRRPHGKRLFRALLPLCGVVASIVIVVLLMLDWDSAPHPTPLAAAGPDLTRRLSAAAVGRPADRPRVPAAQRPRPQKPSLSPLAAARPAAATGPVRVTNGWVLPPQPESPPARPVSQEPPEVGSPPARVSPRSYTEGQAAPALRDCRPEIRCTGIIRTPGGMVAIINNSPVTVGQTVAKAKVVEIRQLSVLMELEGKRFTVGISASAQPDQSGGQGADVSGKQAKD